MSKAIGWLLGLVLTTAPAFGQDTAAGRFVAGLVREMQATQPAEFRPIILRHADVPALARGAVARHWERMSEAQRKRYVSLYEIYVVTALARRAARDSAERIVFVEERAIGERQMLVGARVTLADGKTRLVHWRVREAEGRLLVADVLDEGVSLAALHRADLSGWLNAHNGDIEAFLTMFAGRAARGD
jgi:phospholipid transport system substrate-binding protein